MASVGAVTLSANLAALEFGVKVTASPVPAEAVLWWKYESWHIKRLGGGPGSRPWARPLSGGLRGLGEVVAVVALAGAGHNLKWMADSGRRGRRHRAGVACMVTVSRPSFCHWQKKPLL